VFIWPPPKTFNNSNEMWDLTNLPLHKLHLFKENFWEATTSILAKKIQPEIQQISFSKKKNLIKSDQNRGFHQIFLIFLISLRIVFVQSWFGMFRLKF